MKISSKKHEQFLTALKIKQLLLFNQITIISNYESFNKSLFVRTKYGICKSRPDHLLNGHFPNTVSALDPTLFFSNKLQDLNFDLFNSIKIIGKYVNENKKILIQDKYGLCLISPNKLLQGHKSSIHSAINKTQYFINQAKEIHGDLYDYSLVNYLNAKTKVQIISKYKTFWQTPSSHLNGQGCPILGTQSNYKYNTYIKKGLRSFHYNGFKVYIIRCWNDEEEFYKIGKTYTKMRSRYKDKRDMPYNYEITNIINFSRTFEEGYKCCQLEHNLHFNNKNFRYLPKIKFGGSTTECFKSIENIQCYLNL